MNLTPAQQSMRDMWIAEMWRPVRELPREEREVARAVAAACEDGATRGASTPPGR